MKTYNVILAEISENSDTLMGGTCLMDTTIYRSVQPKYMKELMYKKDKEGFIYDLGIGIGLIVITAFLCFLFYKIGKASK